MFAHICYAGCLIVGIHSLCHLFPWELRQHLHLQVLDPRAQAVERYEAGLLPSGVLTAAKPTHIDLRLMHVHLKKEMPRVKATLAAAYLIKVSDAQSFFLSSASSASESGCLRPSSFSSFRAASDRTLNSSGSCSHASINLA